MCEQITTPVKFDKRGKFPVLILIPIYPTRITNKQANPTRFDNPPKLAKV